MPLGKDGPPAVYDLYTPEELDAIRNKLSESELKNVSVAKILVVWYILVFSLYNSNFWSSISLRYSFNCDEVTIDEYSSFVFPNGLSLAAVSIWLLCSYPGAA